MAEELTTYDIANDTWLRYRYLRDNGFLEYVYKARRCEDFFAGLQWEPQDLAALRAQKRPALTINKIISTVSNIMGEQIYNRTETAFRPRNEGATEDLANVLTKVFMQISDRNQMPWVRSDVFADGVITSRGFYDVRLDFSESLRGEVAITQLNPKNVLIDIDADEYDPDKWGDVLVSKWLSPDQIELLYSKEAADELRSRPEMSFMYGFDSLDYDRDRFGPPRVTAYYQSPEQNRNITRNIRTIERQWKKLRKVEHFVDVRTGDLEQIPQGWDYNKISQYLSMNPNYATMKKFVPQIRWTVIADRHVLHDDWSPYKHFTVVPFFPYFRRGRTVGIVENLLGPQELLNKVSSQELHVVNTTANSGWKIKRGALQNMEIGELEQKGATTGLVLELDEIANAEKITPNNTPTGLDRISYKAEEHIKTISAVNDYRTGNAREDVSSKSVLANQRASSSNFAKVLDNLNRTDYLLARATLDIVQEYYLEERLLHITTDRLMGRTEQLTVNQVTPEGQVLNDLSLGAYEIIITSQPERDTFEDTQFDQAVAMKKEVGIAVPDSFIVKASRLKDKAELVQALEAQANSPQAQQMQQLGIEKLKAEIEKLKADAEAKSNQAVHSQAKAQKDAVQTQLEAAAGPEQDNSAQEMALKSREVELKHQRESQQMDREHALKREQADREHALNQEKMHRDHQLKLVEARTKAALEKHAAKTKKAA